mmetsp:Transcript_33479/g.59019  ORF Transcript_33479/g.59019 Transcript_33479/m.59019 type:complete len:574 (-) Transcript_33479:81-1802(-)
MSFDICVYIDRELDLQVMKTVRCGMPIAALKGMLSQDDSFAGISSSDILLSLSEGGRSLRNDFVLKGDVTEMYIVNGDEVEQPPAESPVAAASAPAKPSAPSKPASFKIPTADEILALVGEPRKVLGLSDGAGSNDIRKAYHRLALQYHPDKAGSEEVFRAVSDAYLTLTSAKDKEGGWLDLEGQAVGPWTAHAHGVNCVVFDCFGAPPWEGRRLYTGSWMEGKVKCWSLSKGEPGKVAEPPRLIGEIEVAGFLNDVAPISPTGLLTAQSAGYIPQPGESLRAFNLEVTPFQVPERTQGAAAIADGDAGGPARLEDAGRSLELATQEDEQEKKPKQPTASLTDLSQTQLVYLHGRGCRKLSLWPRPLGRDSNPRLVASVSKDMIGVSTIGADGCSVDMPAVWKRENPHSSEDANALVWCQAGKVVSGANDKTVKLWDVEAGTMVQEYPVGFHMTSLEVWMEPGVIVGTHAGGVAYLDMRAGTVAQNQYKSKPVSCVSCVKAGHPMMFMGLGHDLMQYDTRCFADGAANTKPKAIGQWTLRGNVQSVHCTLSNKGNLIVACGSNDGKVAAFDTT